MDSESEFLRWLSAQSRASDFVRIDIGDDLAALAWKAEDLLLVGIDQVLDGVHFDSGIHSPFDIGRKAMNRNLSDCAAMACLPFAAVVSVALPRESSIDFAQSLYKGLRAAADPFDCAIVGGDTSAWAGALAMSVAIIGRSAGIEPITRSGAKVGDAIYVTGPLGGSRLGRHMTFSPRVHLARELASTRSISAMIDISDGLARDLDRICRASDVAALLDARLIPIHPDADEMSRNDNRPALDHALFDGEDHELLFTAPASLNHGDCTRIGVIVEPSDPSSRLQIEDATGPRDLPPSGWESW